MKQTALFILLVSGCATNNLVASGRIISGKPKTVVVGNQVFIEYYAGEITPDDNAPSLSGRQELTKRLVREGPYDELKEGSVLIGQRYLVYVARRNDTWFVVDNGFEHGYYDEIQFVDKTDGRLVFGAKAGTSSFVFLGSQITGPWQQVVIHSREKLSFEFLATSKDGCRRVKYAPKLLPAYQISWQPCTESEQDAVEIDSL